MPSPNALYILGSGTPTPTSTRFGTASVLKLGDDHLLFDCGPATTHKLVKAGLEPTWINHLFLTHHHFDHNVDLPCFLLCRWDQSIGKEAVLKVFGPEPTRAIVDKLVGPAGAFADDWKARTGHKLSQSVHANRGGRLPRPEPMLDVRDVEPGETCKTERWRVSACQVRHVEPFLRTFAYRVDTDQGSIVFAGDTGPCAGLVAFASGTDVFVANCWDHQETMDANGEDLGQTGTLDAAKFARDTGAGTLVLAHSGAALCAPGSRERAIGDIAGVYDGRVIFGSEGMVLDLWED